MKLQIFWNSWTAQLNQKSSLKIVNFLAAKFEKWAHIWCQLVTKSDLIAGINFRKVKIWDKSLKKWGRCFDLLGKSKFETCPYKSGGNTWFYLESLNLRQVRTKLGEISASTRKVQIWDKSVQKWGIYLLTLGKSKFGTSPYKIGGDICFY